MHTRDTVGALVYRLLEIPFGLAVRLYYRRIDVRHPERIPASGPLLIVANHPASLTDVLVLGTAIRRRLHFVAFSGLFRNPLLGGVLRLVGTLPVYRMKDAPDDMARNQETFAAVHRLLGEGGAVLIFPEGTSASDRKVEKLKTGAARMALAYAFGDAARDDLALVPIGLHFAERAAFRSDVVLSVGRAVPLQPLESLVRQDPREAARRLTDAIQAALEKLILHVPSEDLVQLVRDVEQLYLDDLRESAPPAPDLALVRGIVESMEFYRRTDPERLYRLWRFVSAYRRKLATLELTDRTVRGSDDRPGSLRLLVRGALGLPIAAAGTVVNYVPYRLAGTLGSWFGPDPTRVAFSRIVCGVVLFPATYTTAAWLLARRAGWGRGWIALLLVACIPLGLYALRYARWVALERERLRFAMLRLGNPRMLARLRRERRRLMQLLDRARDEYLASVAAAGGTSE